MSAVIKRDVLVYQRNQNRIKNVLDSSSVHTRVNEMTFQHFGSNVELAVERAPLRFHVYEHYRSSTNGG